MKICTVQFCYNGGMDYDELYRVYRESIRYHMPGMHVDTIFINPPLRDNKRSYAYKYNSAKLAEWVKYIDSETDDIILTDCDMLMTGDCSHAFDVDFDIAVTKRYSMPRRPYNGGVIMVRPNDRSRAFFHKMLEINDRMYNDIQFHRDYDKRYCGMNQAAFGWMVENYTDEIDMHEYSTLEWNAVDSDWQHITEKTVFVHIKGSLRRKVLNREVPSGPARYAMELWYDIAGYEPDTLVPATSAPTKRKSKKRKLYTHKQLRREAAKMKKRKVPAQTKKQLRWVPLIQRIPRPDAKIAEIGVHKCSTAKHALSTYPNLNYMMIDPWSTEQDDSYRESGAMDSMYTQEQYDEMYNNAVQLANKHSCTYVARMKSADAAAISVDRSFDIVFIDGDHSYEGVKRDISAWLPKIKPGGYICGHDYGSPRYPGVKRAVHEFFSEADVELDIDKTWFYRVKT